MEKNLASKIKNIWDTWDRQRQTTLDINREVESHIIFSDKKELYGKLPDIQETCESLISQIDNSLFKSANGLFTVENKDPLVNSEKANIQKGSIVWAIKKGKLLEDYSECTEQLVKKGEFIAFHEWVTTTKTKRVEVQTGTIPSVSVDPMTEQEIITEIPQYGYEIQEVPDYEGVKITNIEPKNLVWDVSKPDFYNPNCLKIIRKWMSLDEIKENYELTKEQETALSSEVDEDAVTDIEPVKNNDDYSELNKKDGFEVLEAWGTVKDGKETYKNHVITVVNGEHVIRQEPNPYYKCPIVYFAYYTDPKTGRGLSMLYTAVGLNEKATRVFDANLDQLRYSNNPEFWVAEGSVSEKTIISEPGKIHTYKNKVGLPGQEPKPIQNTGAINTNFSFLEFFEKKIEQVTGINKYASGDQGGIARTATESKNIVAGTNSRLGRILNKISNKAIIPSISLIALMIELNSENQTIQYLKDDGTEELASINESIRGGDYDYTIGNSQSLVEQKMLLAEIRPVIAELGNAGLPFNLMELWNYVAQTMEIANPQRFIDTQKYQQMQTMENMNNVGLGNDEQIEASPESFIPNQQ